MNLVGIENITPYKDVFEYSIYEYEDTIDLGNKDLLLCDLKVILTKVEEVYISRMNKSLQIIALIKNLKSEIDKNKFEEEVKEFIFQEIYEENLEKENIDVMFIQG